MRGVGDHPAGEVGVADVADLSRRDQVVQGGECLVDRGYRVRAVQLVQVDVVGLEPGEGLLHGGLDVAAPALRAGRRPVPHVRVGVPPLGGEHHLVAAALERLAERALRTAVLAVAVGGVEQRDALVDRRADHRVRLRGVDAAAEVVAAEAYHGDEQAGITQRSIAHTWIIRRVFRAGTRGTGRTGNASLGRTGRPGIDSSPGEISRCKLQPADCHDGGWIAGQLIDGYRRGNYFARLLRLCRRAALPGGSRRGHGCPACPRRRVRVVVHAQFPVVRAATGPPPAGRRGAVPPGMACPVKVG